MLFKKYTVLLLSTLTFVIAGCSASTSDSKESNSSSEETTSVVQSETTSETTSSTDNSNPESSAVGPIFEESIVRESLYPVSNPIDGVDSHALLEAMSAYYLENLSTDEQLASQEPMNQAVIEHLAETLNNDDTIAQLEPTTDLVSITLANQTLYVPRIIIPMDKAQADAILPEHDVEILNTALAETGNRIVMLAYYNPTTKILTPSHLTNTNTSLFYYDPTE